MSIRNPYAKKTTAPVTAPQASASTTPASGSTSAPSALPQQQQLQQQATATNIESSDRDQHVLLQHQPHVLYVSPKQRGNTVLEYVKNVPVQYHNMVPDYIFSATSCGLFLSVKYHTLYPQYIQSRIAALRNDFRLRILLVYVDNDDNAAVLRQLNKLCVNQNFTFILAWSEAEAARYLETYKALDGKDASFLQKSKDNNYTEQIIDVLTSCKPLNRTDSINIISQFGSFRQASSATPDELALVSGLGTVKVQKLYKALHKPFSTQRARERRHERLAERRAEAKHNDNHDDDDNEIDEEKVLSD